MTDGGTIHEYAPDCRNHVEHFYGNVYNKHRTRRILGIMLARGRTNWCYGLMAILATPITMKSAGKLLALWQLVWTVRWYRRLAPRYDNWVQHQMKRRMDQLMSGKVWLMMDKEQVTVLGVARFDRHHHQEGQIQVTAQGSRIELALVQISIQFARQQDVNVITQAPPEIHNLDSFL
jgi:hypothetical protein